MNDWSDDLVCVYLKLFNPGKTAFLYWKPGIGVNMNLRNSNVDQVFTCLKAISFLLLLTTS